MGRVISGGGVFNPKIERRNLPQRVPIDESLARQYLSPQGIAQTASLIGSIPIPEAVSKYFMKEDKEPKGDGITPQPTPAQEIAAKRVGSLVMQGTPGQSAKAGLTRTPQLAQPQPMSEEAYDSLRFAEARPQADFREFSKAATRSSAFSGVNPPISTNPQATTDTYNLQLELVGTLGSDGKPYLSPEDWKTGPGIFGRKTRMALAKREADRKKTLGVLQAEVDQRQRILDQYGDDPDGRAHHQERLETAKRKLQEAQQQFAPTAQQPAPAAPQPAPIAPQPAQAEEQPVDTRQPVEADESLGVAPRFEANVPEAPPVTKAMRFEKAVADAGFDKFGGDMDFMRATAKFADTEEEVKMVLSAMDLVKVPPRTIGDLLTGAHKDRFRKEIMGLFPKLKAAPKPVSDLDRAKAEYYRAGTELRGAQTKKVKAEKKKLLGGSKGTGNRGRKLFIQRTNEAVSQVKKLISLRDPNVQNMKANYGQLKDDLATAERALKRAQSQYEEAEITQEQLGKFQNDVDEKRDALDKFSTSTDYQAQIEELDDLRERAAILGSLGDRAAEKFTPDLWDSLAEQRTLLSEAVAVRKLRKWNEERAAAKSKKQAEDLVREAKKQAAQKQREEEARILRVLSEKEILGLFLPVYQNTKLFKEHFTKFAKSAGVRNRSVEDYNNPRRIPYQDVVALLNYVSENDPGGYLKNLWDTNQLETPETLRQQAKPR